MVHREVLRLYPEPLHYGWATWFIVVHMLGLGGAAYAAIAGQVQTIWFAAGYFLLCHLSISCGAHRLYAHVSYHATRPLQLFLILFFSGVVQGPIAWWSGKHRLHHKEVDTNLDPHSPRFGFLRAHMGWMWTKAGIAPPPTSYMRFGKRERQLVLWQYKHYWMLAIIMGVLVPTLACGLLWGDWIGGILIAVGLRLMLQYHLTWIVNSVCHTYGTEVTGGGTARDIWWLGVFTVGESYHGSHHADDTDWRLGRTWWAIDLSKWFLQFCFLVRLARPRGASS